MHFSHSGVCAYEPKSNSAEHGVCSITLAEWGLGAVGGLRWVPHRISIPLFVFVSPTEHSNYFGTDEKLGVVAVSVRREKLDDTKELKDQYQYRLIIRTSEVPAAPSHRDGGGVTTRLDLALIPYRLRPRLAPFFASSPPSPVVLGLTSPPRPSLNPPLPVENSTCPF